MDHGSPSSAVMLNFAAGGSFSDSAVGQLSVSEGGDRPAMYFVVNADKGYGYEIRRVGR